MLPNSQWRWIPTERGRALQYRAACVASVALREDGKHHLWIHLRGVRMHGRKLPDRDITGVDPRSLDVVCRSVERFLAGRRWDLFSTTEANRPLLRSRGKPGGKA